MAYRELIKNFEKIRDYMRDFYVYGFRTRTDFDRKSARSYDNERRRIESWLSDAMSFRQDASGKQVFLSVDNRSIAHNPLYQAFKAKSFTDKDITLHFYLLDILADGEALPFQAIVGRVAEYYHFMESDDIPDDSTVRNKLKEYVGLGLLRTEKQGREVLYARTDSQAAPALLDAIAFASESMPLGVIGSFLLDKYREAPDYFRFKHHYLLQAMDSDILSSLLECRRMHCRARITYRTRHSASDREAKVFPLKVYVSTRTGRENLLAYHYQSRRPHMYRLDHIVKVVPLEEEPDPLTLDTYGARYAAHLWGTSAGNERTRQLDHIEVTIHVEPEESHIIHRLEREKRNGTVKKTAEHTYLFTADVYDSQEMLPWLRTFIGRIEGLTCSNQATVDRFYEDLAEMETMYR